jgi:PKD repeat protein
MRFHPKKLYAGCLIFLIFSLACSKDTDLLKDYVISEESDIISIVENPSSSDTSEDTSEDNESSVEDGFETRITSFPPIEDAYMAQGKGYNESLIRMEENLRSSYLLFDLTQIGELGGYITDVKLLLTIRAIEGNGDITVFDSSSSDWSEDNLSTENVPTKDIVLGSISDIYKVGSTQEIILNASDILTDLNSLILEHANGDPFAYASKEHQSGGWPKLVVTYNIPEEAREIEIEEPKYESTDSDSSSGEEDNTSNQGSSEDGASGSESENENTEDSTDNEENESPVAFVNADPKTGDAPLLVQFWGNYSTDDKQIESYSWEFQDGDTSSSINPRHTFTEPGEYQVSLTVTDAEGLSDSKNIVIVVNEPEPVNEAPIAKATASTLSGTAPLSVQFSANESSDDNGITRYRWIFGLNNPGSARNLTRTFSTPGEYTVRLTVWDEQGLQDSDVLTIIVEQNTNNSGGGAGGENTDETNTEDSDVITDEAVGTGYVPPTADVPELVFNWVAREQTGADGTPITSATDHSDNPTTVRPFNVDVKIRNGRPEADFGNSGTARFELGNPAKLLFAHGVTSGTILYVAGTDYRGALNAVVFKGDQQSGPGEFSMVASRDDVYGRTYSGGAAQAADKGSQTADYEVVALTFEAEGANTRNTFWFEGVEAINNSDYTHRSSTVSANTEWFIGIEKDSGAGNTFAWPYNGSLLAVLIFRDRILTGQEMIDIRQEILDMPEGGY